MEVFKRMEKDGVELNLSMLNLLINAFGVAGRYNEAFSVFDYILEVVRSCPEQCMNRVGLLLCSLK
jgi:pentatricopeptide repeat protein